MTSGTALNNVSFLTRQPLFFCITVLAQRLRYDHSDGGSTSGTAGFRSSAQCPDRLRDQPSLTSNGHRLISSGVKQPGRECDQSLPPSIKVKNAWSYTSASPHICMTAVFIRYHRQCYIFSLQFKVCRPH
jgi:hypothetical protein